MSEMTYEQMQAGALMLRHLFAARVDGIDQGIAAARVAALRAGADPEGETFAAVSAFMYASAAAVYTLTKGHVDHVYKAEAGVVLNPSTPEFRQMMLTLFDSMVSEAAG